MNEHTWGVVPWSDDGTKALRNWDEQYSLPEHDVPPEVFRAAKNVLTLDEVLVSDLAPVVHDAYLDACQRFGWPVKSENRMSYSELSTEAQELDRNIVRAVLDALKDRAQGEE